MIRLYQIGIHFYSLLLTFASLFNKKAKLWTKGQKNVFHNLPSNPNSEIVWVHCASLGEYEQAIPLLKKIKEWKPNYSLLVTFFSPSGYVNAKQEFTDYKSYLPLDTKKNSQQFLDIVKPKLAILIKNEFWPNYLYELQKRNIPIISASALFRSSQLIFKPYGKWLLDVLKNITHFYVQNETSKILLINKGFTNISISGDGRYDRVRGNLADKKSIPYIETFKSDKKLIVCGSTYEIDSKMIINISRRHPDLKFIIAPHEIELSPQLKQHGLLYSQSNDKNVSEYSVLIIDSIGILSRLYQYADVAYVGGGFGHKGLHNILEPLAFDVPIIFGPNYQKFPEAIDALNFGIADSIRNSQEFEKIIHQKLSNPTDESTISNFCNDRSGASNIVFEGLKTHL
ncbi:MAG: 3-deoxy-D-manno-octulosonic acid transferase [Flavobacteriales bacterium]|nr:3-deoxy-D-manno-octulosonic acid transferase [Flavobacteriales bacterium]